MRAEESCLVSAASSSAAACRNPCNLLPTLVGFWLALPVSGSATLLASETFESYAVGALSGQGGGADESDNWTMPGANTRASVVDTTSNPMLYMITGGDVIHGGSRALEVQLSAAPASQLCGVRTLVSPIAQTFYVGYLVRYHAGAGWLAASIKSS